jgi:hypothetical protein
MRSQATHLFSRLSIKSEAFQDKWQIRSISHLNIVKHYMSLLRPGSWRVSCQSGRAFMVQIDVMKYLGHINNTISCVRVSQMQEVALTLSAVFISCPT